MGTTTAAYSALQAIRLRKAQMETEKPDLTVTPAAQEAAPVEAQPQDADAIRAADPVERKATAMSQMDQTAQVESGGGEENNPMSSMPGQQGGKDALAASNKTSAEGAAAVAQIEAMAGPGPQARPAYQPRGIPQSNLFKRQFRRF